jgi:hypothetical protein
MLVFVRGGIGRNVVRLLHRSRMLRGSEPQGSVYIGIVAFGTVAGH